MPLSPNLKGKLHYLQAVLVTDTVGKLGEALVAFKQAVS